MPTRLKPPIQKGKEPPFYDMNPMIFQDLCRDLVGVQEPFKNCRIYGNNGQSQFGIDIRCDRKSGALEVAQAKCDQHFTPANIIDASNEFIKYLGFWQSEGVKKFILIVACRVSSTQANNQIVLETKRFQELGIEYDLWDAIRIRDILRDHNKLIPTYFSPADFWIKEIGGDLYRSPYNSQPNFTVGLINETMAAAFNDLSSKVNAKASRELEENRILWREGKGESVSQWIEVIKDETGEWGSLSAEIRASILRLEAIITIDYSSDYEKAERLLNEAKAIDPDGPDPRFRSILQFHRNGPQAGLDTLGNADDVDSLCVRASLLINSERFIDAVNILEGIFEKGKAEVHRLLALAYLNLKDLERAEREIKEAFYLAPNWESVQIVEGIVSYFSALSPAILSHTSFIWPIPVEFAFLKTTDQAVSALEKAACIFEKVARNSYRTERDKLSLQIWHAACLAGDFRKQENAKQLFEELLRKNPTDLRLISWALERGYLTSLTNCRSELKKLLQKNLAKTEHIISTVMLDINFKHFRNIFYLLETNKKIFIEDGNEFLWEFWFVQALIASKKLGDARKRIEVTQFSTILEPLELTLLHKESEISGDAQPFIDFLLKGYLDGKQSIYLWELCNLYVDTNKWEQVDPYVEILVNEIQTLESLRLSSSAFYKEKKYRECKAFIDRHRSLCFQSELPENLRLIYIMSKAFSGEFSEALSELRLLAALNPSRQNLILLRNFYMQKGDRAGLRDVASLARQREDILPGDIITFADSVFWASRDLAEEMWRLSPPEQLNSQKQVEKMMLGFALGLDHEMGELSKHVHQMSETEQTLLRPATKEEVIKAIQEENRQKNELFLKYRVGEIPIHTLIGNAGLNLFALYKNIIRDNSNPLAEAKHKYPLYVRYGGRATPRGFEEPEPVPVIEHLTLDTSSLLLLEHFSLLSILEAEIKSFYLPSNTVLALVQMKDNLLRYQPEVVRASKLVSDLLGEKRIKEIVTKPIFRSLNLSEKEILQEFVHNIEQEKGFIVGFGENLHIWKSVGLGGENIQFATCGDVIESLKNIGAISEDERINGINRLGSSGQYKTNRFIPVNSNLYFVANTITLAAQTEVFDQLCSNFSVWIENEEVLRIRAAIKDERDRQNYASSLQVLIDRVSKGIDKSKYIFVPAADSKEEVDRDILFENLVGSISSNQSGNSLPVIDDLAIQKYLYVQGVRFYGIYEILSWLHQRGSIDDVRYYECISDFRRADLRYIPVSKDEILFYLRKAGDENGEQIENSGLQTLRSYIAECLVYGKKLEIPIQPFNSVELMGEMDFLFSLIHAVSYTITEIWQDDVPDSLKISRSAWIIDNLFLDMLSLCRVIGWKREPKDHLFLVSLGLAEFFLNGFRFYYKQNGHERKSFFTWIYRAVCEPIFDVNPGLLEKTVDYIRTSISNIIDERTEPDADRIMTFLAGKLYNDLPDPIKKSLYQDRKFLQRIGVQIITVIEVANIMFPSRVFWNKLADVLSGTPSFIQAVSPDIKVHLLPFESKNGPGVTFVHPQTSQNINIESMDFAFLVNQGYDQWVEEHLDSFIELSRQQLQEAVEQISRKSGVAERFELLDKLRRSSIGYTYQVFEGDLVNRKLLDFDHLGSPSTHSLLQFFGLSNPAKKTGTIADQLSLAADRLIDQHGLNATLIRLCSFPIELPDMLFGRISMLSLDEREMLFSELFDRLITPLNRIHLIRILREYPDTQNMIPGLVTSFFNQGAEKEFLAFSLLLSWTTNALDQLADIRKTDDETKLLIAWGHSDHLFRIIKRVSVPFDWLGNMLKDNHSSLYYKTLLFDKPNLRDDVACGEKLDFLSFRILGLGFAFKGDSLPSELQEKLLNEVFPYKENEFFPAIDMLRDRSLMANRLDSFLSRELSEALSHLTAVERERISIISTSALQELASLAVSWITEPNSVVSGWQLLIGIYQNQTLPKSLQELYVGSIRKYSYIELAQDYNYLAFMALQFTACQAQFFSEADRSHLKEEILRLAEIGPSLFVEMTTEENQPFGKDVAISLLSEAAFRVALPETGREFGIEFSTLVRGIVTRWRDTQKDLLRLLNSLVRGLPISIAQDLAEILVELRAIK